MRAARSEPPGSILNEVSFIFDSFIGSIVVILVFLIPKPVLSGSPTFPTWESNLCHPQAILLSECQDLSREPRIPNERNSVPALLTGPLLAGLHVFLCCRFDILSPPHSLVLLYVIVFLEQSERRSHLGHPDPMGCNLLKYIYTH